MKTTKKVFVRNIMVFISMIIIVGLGILIYLKSSSYPITESNKRKVEKINSTLSSVSADINQIEKFSKNENEKNKVMELEQKAMEDIGELDLLLENFKFKKTPDKGLLLWINCAFASKDAYLMNLSSYSSGDSKGNNEFNSNASNYINEGLKEMKKKDENAYRYFKRNGYFEGFYNQ
ncbi:hypothetical protein [Gottfriedia acidiceleris]|uniref:hypothetical protein n=1 Tax=Gottfriedia acidiceleris TaxID=371036 RepID=UPI000B431A6F|nr:hypothetical protein [Gottfriedia acidiceleris]